MFRQIPTVNKICAAQDNQLNQQILTQHLQSMRPQIDNRPPKQYEFLKNKKIKDAKQQVKQTEIDRGNQNLITKITTIMRQPQGKLVYIEVSMNNSALKRSESSNLNAKKSLNQEHRKKELIKIVMENQLLLKRIQDQRSAYNVTRWNDERKGVEKYIANICEYPYKDFKPTKTHLTFNKMSDSSLQKRDRTVKLEPLNEENNKQLLTILQEQNDKSNQGQLRFFGTPPGVFQQMHEELVTQQQQQQLSTIENENINIQNQEQANLPQLEEQEQETHEQNEPVQQQILQADEEEPKGNVSIEGQQQPDLQDNGQQTEKVDE